MHDCCIETGTSLAHINNTTLYAVTEGKLIAPFSYASKPAAIYVASRVEPRGGTTKTKVAVSTLGLLRVYCNVRIRRRGNHNYSDQYCILTKLELTN